ncbi:DNA methyltransferase [Botrimarina sp.]|uniref:class I SAM-dependent DNA methyltransferase n=1 Tax=Botrimarina sp. TaxID=2795802 RepID=UPI0032EAA663
MDADAFIARWSASGGSERSNYQLFLAELCELLDVEHPDPAGDDNRHNAYVFERAITFDNRDGTQSTKFADLYKRGSFICETKQGVERRDQEELFSERAQAAAQRRRTGHGRRGTKGYELTMRRAVGQAEQYARHLPADEGRPPFLMVVDVGDRIELYSEFSQTGGAYTPFPDARSHRIKLTDLAQEEVRDTLRRVWTDPLSLDPSRRSAKVTRDIAGALAKLAKALEQAGHQPDQVAQFLMRCLFTMFAEDIGLLSENSFLDLLKSIDDPAHFQPVMQSLWRTMDEGGFSTDLRQTLKRFNGGLFAEQTALPLNRDQLDLMIEAASAKWNDVEPAIFGTLLERALDPVERHKLGAHYTPRAYVERLVVPTVVEPLREEWDAARVAAITLAEEGDTKGAAAELTRFHDRLCEVRVLDPACGSGNFLYVVLEHLKRIEGEVFDAYDELVGDRQIAFDLSHTVNPEQLLGIEINPRAAAIAELVLWIGYLQWHYRTRGKVDPPEPIIRDLHNIECRDAVLAYDHQEVLFDEKTGERLTIWDGRTTKPSPVTGREVPDESARVPQYRYINPRKAMWPAAEFVVGNPPFIGTRRMRLTLGDGYVDALVGAWPKMPENADYVMFWWHHAATLLQHSELARFGFITTNSFSQSFNRAAVRPFLEADNRVSIVFAIRDHPWIDSADGAGVRVAMTVAEAGEHNGLLAEQCSELKTQEGATTELEFRLGKITSDLRIGVSPASAVPLRSNQGVAFWGTKFYGDGFIVSAPFAEELREKQSGRTIARSFVSGRDLTGVPRRLMCLDCDGLDESTLRTNYPASYQHLLDTVKPVRQHNRRAFKRERWWIFGENQPGMRSAVDGITRFVATTETAKHRVFQNFDSSILAEGTVAVIALEDHWYLGVLSSRVHSIWSLAAGGTLESRPRYNKTVCFEPFPFPKASVPLRDRIGDLAEQLDAHRKARQAEHPKLTMTGMYNVLEKLRSGEDLTDKERTIHEQGLVSVLRQIHDDLDAAVAEAYGWPVDLSDEEILERLVALNHERAEEEKRGLVRWLRPEYQNPDGVTQKAAELADDAPAKTKATAKVKKRPWPKTLAEQAAAVGAVLATLGEPADEADIAKAFTRAKKDRIAELLATLAAIGKARVLDDGRFVAA